jgi:ectoine hydroxylase-related dioxygenase (phytanoyl-CoA dioxygenase family)
MWFHNSKLAKSDNYFRLPAHQEWSNMQGSTSGIVVWSPLVEVTEEMGLLQVISGSHLNGLMPIKGSENNNYPLEINNEFNDSEFTNVKLNVGDILLFHPLLVHRSGINTSDKIRWTINFRFNNSMDKEFTKRDFFNPFTYQAPSILKTNLLPTKESVLSSLNVQFNKE